MPDSYKPPLQGKQGLVLGIANENSIAYAPSQDLHNRLADSSQSHE